MHVYNGEIDILGGYIINIAQGLILLEFSHIQWYKQTRCLISGYWWDIAKSESHMTECLLGIPVKAGLKMIIPGTEWLFSKTTYIPFSSRVSLQVFTFLLSFPKNGSHWSDLLLYSHRELCSYSRPFPLGDSGVQQKSLLPSVLIPLFLTPTLQLSDDNLNYLTLPGSYLVSTVPCKK